MRFSKKIIVTMFAFLFAFVIVILTLFWLKGEIPDTLVTCVFGFFGVEGGCLAMIKATETKHSGDNKNEDRNNENNDRNNENNDRNNENEDFNNGNESEDNDNDGFDTDSGSDTDNGSDNSIPDTLPEGKDRGEEARRAVKVGVYRLHRR